MVNSSGTSFIPQRPTKGKVNTRRVRKVYVLSYISSVMFFGSVLAAAGVFFFNFSLNAQLDHQKEQLASERQQFNQGDIESIRDLEKRIDSVQQRLDNHISVLSVLEALERSAVQSVNYITFSYKRLGDTAPIVTLTGDSDRIDGIVFQREVLQANPILAGSTFTEVALQSAISDDGSKLNKVVTFSFEKEIDPNLVSYTPRGVSNGDQSTDNNSGSMDPNVQGGDQHQQDQTNGAETAESTQSEAATDSQQDTASQENNDTPETEN